MKLQDQNILFFTRTMALGGTESVILQLCEVFKPLVNKIVVCSSGGINEEKLALMGIKHYTIPDIEQKSLGNLVYVSRKIKQIVKDERITVIHTHHRMAAFYCQITGTVRRIRCINTSHTAFYDKRQLTHFAFTGFKLVACGENVKKSLVNGLGFKENRISVICNGVKKSNIDSVEPIPEIQFAKKQGKTIIAAIGRLSKEKGVEYLMKAMQLLRDQQILCVLAGNGPEEEHLKTLAAKLGLQDNVLFLGYRKDVDNILSQIDFLIQPSLQEGLPLTPIEAFSMGKTVIGTNIDGTSEIIKDGYNGFLIEPANEFELSEAVRKMCTIDRSNLEKNALLTYWEKYSFEAFSGNYIKFYVSIEI